MADASNAVAETRGKFQQKQKDLAEVMELARTSNPNVWDLTRKSVQEKLGATSKDHALETLKAWNKELDDLGGQLEQAQLKELSDAAAARDRAISTPVHDYVAPTEQPTLKSLGELFVETKQYTEGWKKNHTSQPATIDMSIKTLMERTAGYAPESVRSGLVVPAVSFSLAEILELIPVFPTAQAQFKYMEETLRTHSSAEKAEGAAYAESAFGFTERSSPVEKITDSIPVTDEQLEDENAVASLLDQRLRFGIKRRLATAVLSGTGTPPVLRGILNTGGIQSQAKGADSIQACAYKAITKVRVTGQAEPNAFVFHPNDWQAVVLAQETTGGFLWGHPSQAPQTQLWGLRVALSTGITENTGLVGDFSNFSRIDEKRGIEVQVGYVNAQFTEGEKTLRAQMRAAFTATRPAAFCTMTSI